MPIKKKRRKEMQNEEANKFSKTKKALPTKCVIVVLLGDGVRPTPENRATTGKSREIAV